MSWNYTMNYTGTVFLLFGILLAISAPLYAGETALTAEKPTAEAFRTALDREISTLNVPVEMSTDDLAKILNQTIRKDLYKGSTTTKGVSADIVRNGSILVSAADNFLYITLPVVMTLGTSMFETKPIPLKLKFRATARVTPDWRLHADVFYLGISELLAEEIGLGPFSFKPRSMIDSATRPLQKMLSDMMSNKINDQLQLKTQISKVWNSAQTPFLLDKAHKTWLALSPREVMLSPLYAHNNRIHLSVGISTLADVVVGPAPVTPPLRPLPNLKLVKTFDKTFRIALNADVFYKDLRTIAAPLLLGREFDADGKSVTIKDFDLSGNGDKLVVKLVTEGSFDGVLYLTAKPAFNPQTRLFSFEDVDFDMQTESLLLKSAGWFLHGAIRSIIQDKLNMNLTGQLEQSRQIAARALNRMQLMEHVFLTSTIKELKFKDALVQQDKISILVYSEGESAILFQ